MADAPDMNERGPRASVAGSHSTHASNPLVLPHVVSGSSPATASDWETTLTRTDLGSPYDLFDRAPVAYLMLDAGGFIREANQRAGALLGLSRGELLGQPLAAFVHPDDAEAFHRFQKQSLPSEKAGGLELRMRGAEDRFWWAQLVENRTEDSDPLCRVVLNDISPLRQSEAERAQVAESRSHDQLRESLGRLASGVVHNLNNVLASVLGLASVRELAAASEEDRRAFAIIGRAGRRGADLLKSLAQFARPSLPARVPLDLNRLLAELRDVEEEAGGKRVEVRNHFAAEPAWILGDAATLQTALRSLCRNGMDAMPAGGQLTLRVAVPEQAWAELVVEDTGEGMDPEVLARALDPFFTTKPAGTGLGLTNAQGAAVAHAGTLAITSRPGQGTRVTMRFPRVPAPCLEATAPEALATGGPLRVLLVDDDEYIRFAVVRMLKGGDFQVRTAAGGEQALAELQGGFAPDVILLDQNMPGMDGCMTLGAIREIHPELPVFILSGQPDVLEWGCFQRSFVGVLPKPFEQAQLLAELARIRPGRWGAPNGHGTAGAP